MTISILVTALGPADAALAQEGEAVISLVGERTAYVDVAFSDQFQLVKRATKIDFKGTFGGWLIHAVGEPFATGTAEGAYSIRGVGPSADSEPTVMGLGRSNGGTFPPGRYRLYLLADGPADVRIPILEGVEPLVLDQGDSSLTWVSTQAAVTSADMPILAVGAIGAENRSPVQITPNTYAVSVAYTYASPGATAQSIRACIKKPSVNGDDDASCRAASFAGAVQHLQQEYALILSVHYQPGALQPGEAYEAYQRHTFASVAPRRIMGLSVTVEVVTS